MLLPAVQSPVAAATITVDGNDVLLQANSSCSLPEAIFNANKGYAYFSECEAGTSGADVIVLGIGSVFTFATNYSSYAYSPTALPAINSDITIQGNGATIERGAAAPQFRLLYVSESGALTLNSVTLKNGHSAQDGGAIFSAGNLTLNGSTISGNKALGGGGIYSVGPLVLKDSFVTGNTASIGAGLFLEDGDVTIHNTDIQNNVATGFGGGLHVNTADVAIALASDLSNNKGLDGGAIDNAYGGVTIENSTVSANTATRYGGAIFNFEGGVALGAGTILSGNKAAKDGGAIYNDRYASLSLAGVTVHNNIAGSSEPGNESPGSGGAIYSLGEVTIGADSVVSGNVASSRGGAIFSEGALDEDDNCYWYAELAINNATMTGNTTSGMGGSGGAISADRCSHTTITDSKLEANSAPGGNGGAIHFNSYDGGDGLLKIVNSVVTGNQADHGGAVLVFEGPLIIEGGTFSQNKAKFGGALDVTFAPLTITNTRFEANQATADDMEGNGGAIALDDNVKGRQLTMTGVTLTGNTATGDGGGIYNYGGELRLINATFDRNTAFRGGGLFTETASSYSPVTVTGGRFTGNRAAGGAAISSFGYHKGDVIITDTVIDGNVGRAVSANKSILTLDRCLIINNKQGGGLADFEARVTVRNSLISGNSGDNGGGVFNDFGFLHIFNSTISGNAATTGSGGGIFSRDDQRLVTITNSTISGNTAAKQGGGLYNIYGKITIANSTVTGNSAAISGGGFFQEGDSNNGRMTLRRTLIAGNSAPAGREATRKGGNVTANDHNLFGFSNNAGLVGFSPGASDIVGQKGINTILNPALTANGGPLAVGQPIPTHALAGNSPAIDAAPSDACMEEPVGGVDQRQKPRNANGAGSAGNNECDIGAFEAQQLIANLTGALLEPANAASDVPAPSVTGRYVAFASLADNLLPEADDNGAQDIFLLDRVGGHVMLVSAVPDDTRGRSASGGGPSAEPTISDDGALVAFSSAAADLVANDNNNLIDVFISDWAVGSTTRVSAGPGGADANGDSASPALSGDGRFIAFDSAASNLATGDTNGTRDVFVLNRQTGAIGRASLSSSGVQGDGGSTQPAISRDGRFVVFVSAAANLVPGDTNGATDIFIRDRQTGVTTRVSVAMGGGQANGPSTQPAVSSDGRVVVFESSAPNLTPGDANGVADVFVHDRATGVTTRIGPVIGPSHTDAPGGSPDISGDGRYVAFASSEDTLVPGDTNDAADIFIYDRATGLLRRSSVSVDGAQANGDSAAPSLTGDGSEVFFASAADNLAPGDANDVSDIFTRQREAFFVTVLPIICHLTCSPAGH